MVEVGETPSHPTRRAVGSWVVGLWLEWPKRVLTYQPRGSNVSAGLLRARWSVKKVRPWTRATTASRSVTFPWCLAHGRSVNKSFTTHLHGAVWTYHRRPVGIGAVGARLWIGHTYVCYRRSDPARPARDSCATTFVSRSTTGMVCLGANDRAGTCSS